MKRFLFLLPLLLLGACTSIQGSLTGKLSVVVEGLPPGVEARVVVQPGNREVRASQVLELPEGSYEVQAEPVFGPNGERYLPAVEGSPARVEYNKEAQVRVGYALDPDTRPSTLVLLIEGLPPGAEGSVRVRGGDFDRTFGTSTTLTLRPGAYLLEAASVSYRGRTYLPDPAQEGLVLPPGTTLTKTVTYREEVRTGELLVVVEGLPSGTQAQVRVKDGNGTTVASLAGSRLLTLAAGVYFVEADPVGSYVPRVSGSPAQVGVGGRAEVRVVYEQGPQPDFSFSLTPQSVSLAQGSSATLVASITPRNGFREEVRFSLVSPPAGFSLAGGPVTPDGPVDVPLVLAVGQVAPGSYTLVVKAEGGGVSRTQTVAVAVGPSTGQLALSILFEGAPAGAEGYVVVSGSAGDQVVVRSQVLTLPPGTYTVTAYAVTVNGTQYNPDPLGGTVVVQAGQTASFTVTYKPAPSL